jgi:hypothetical protein
MHSLWKYIQDCSNMYISWLLCSWRTTSLTNISRRFD